MQIFTQFGLTSAKFVNTENFWWTSLPNLRMFEVKVEGGSWFNSAYFYPNNRPNVPESLCMTLVWDSEETSDNFFFSLDVFRWDYVCVLYRSKVSFETVRSRRNNLLPGTESVKDSAKSCQPVTVTGGLMQMSKKSRK